jgi:hypothetical protein
MLSTSSAGDGERGATVVEFLGVVLLATAAFLTLLQMALWLWTRNVAVNAADEGARLAAESGRRLGEGEERARAVLGDGLGATGRRFVVGATQDGDAVVVRAEGAAPRVVPFLPAFTVTARARMFDEDLVLDR